VDAKFKILDFETGRQIYMKTPDGKIIYGNVLVGQKLIFDGTGSNSIYPIKEYRWDLDGDGKWDKVMVDKTELVVNKNGYYTVILTVYDYDLQSNSTTKIFKINKLEGNLNESMKTIEIVNELENATDVKIIVNNCDVYNLTVEKKKSLNISINPYGLNEIDVFANGKEKTFLINATNPAKIFIGNEIYMGKEEENKTPGFEFLLLLIALLLFAFRNR